MSFSSSVISLLSAPSYRAGIDARVDSVPTRLNLCLSGGLQPGLISTPLLTRVRCDVDEASLWPWQGVLTHSAGLSD